MKKFFYYIQLPNFDIAADAAATFKVRKHCNIRGITLQSQSEVFSKTRHHNSSSVIIFLQELLTRHKSTVAEFLIENEDWVSSHTVYQIIKYCFKRMYLLHL